MLSLEGWFFFQLIGSKEGGMQSVIQEIIVFLELRIDRKPGRYSSLGMKDSI